MQNSEVKIKVIKYGKSKPCPNCGQLLKFSWLSGMSMPHIFLYASESFEILISEALYEQYIESGENELEFEKNLDQYLIQNGIEDKGFSLKNNLLCNHCGINLSNKNNFSVTSNLNDTAVYLDGMVYRTDKDTFKIKFQEAE